MASLEIVARDQLPLSFDPGVLQILFLGPVVTESLSVRARKSLIIVTG